MKFLITALFIFSVPAFAETSCDLDNFLKSTEGHEKLVGLVERSKSLFVSKLEDMGIEEDQVEVKAVYPKMAAQLDMSLSVIIKAKNLTAHGSTFSLSKVNKDEDCGVEVSLDGGHIINSESKKDFGSLGRVKEFIRF